MREHIGRPDHFIGDLGTSDLGIRCHGRRRRHHKQMADGPRWAKRLLLPAWEADNLLDRRSRR